MKKKFLLLLGLISIILNGFSSEYFDDRNISDVILIQNAERKCFVLYKTDDSEVSMYVENHFDENDCGKRNFFSEDGIIKATSPFLRKEKNGREVICFIGTDSETELEEDILFMFMTGSDYTNYYSKEIPFSKHDNVMLKDFVISDSNEITVLLSINDNILSKTINIDSHNISDRYLFSGYQIEDVKILKNPEQDDLYYGMFFSNNNFYAFVLNKESEIIEKITDNKKIYYSLADKNPVCYVADGELFVKIIYSNLIELKIISTTINPDNIRDLFESDGKTIIIARDKENIYSFTIDNNFTSLEELSICSNMGNPFIYLEKNKYFNNSILMIIKDVGIYTYTNNSWKLLDDYKNVRPYLNPELQDLSINNEKEFRIKIDRNYKNGLFQYKAKINDSKSIPIYANEEEVLDVIKNSSSINDLFYTFIKVSDKIKIISKVN